MSDEVRLNIAGARYGGWKTIRIVRSIESLAGSFSLGVSERWPGSPSSRPVRPGAAASVDLDGDVLITGFIDTVRNQITADSHEVTIEGRDRAADLVDCSPDLDPAEWVNLNVLQFAQQIAGPFDVSVRADVDVGENFPKISLNPGQTAHEAIEERCRYRELLPVSDGLGRLVLTRAGTARASTPIVEGSSDILAADATYSHSDRFSDYVVRGASQGTAFNSGETVAAPRGVARDLEVTRHRPKVIVPSSAADQARCQRRAKWEASVRAGRAARASFTLGGWRQPNGTAWSVNSLVSVRSQTLGIDTTMLITSVELTFDNQGRRTKLDLVRPDAFQLLAKPEIEEAGLGITFDPSAFEDATQ